MRPALSVLAATLVLAASAGCGDDNTNDATGGDTSPPVTATEAPEPTESTDSTATRPEPAPGQSRWAGQVDAACKPIQAWIDAVLPPADAAGLERWLADILPLVHKQVAAVKAIKPPVKDEETRRAKLFIGGLGKLDAALTRYLAAVRSGDTEALQKAVTQVSAAGAATRSYAASLKLTECGGYTSG